MSSVISAENGLGTLKSLTSLQTSSKFLSAFISLGVLIAISLKPTIVLQDLRQIILLRSPFTQLSDKHEFNDLDS